MSMNYFNLLFSRLDYENHQKWTAILIQMSLSSFMEVFSYPEIYLKNCLLEDHFLYKNTKVYLLQHSDAYFLCFIRSRPEVLCKNVVLKNFSKRKNLFKVIFLDNQDFVLE